MSDALPLPPRPNLEQYKTLAKELVHAHESGEVSAWARRWLESLARHLNMEQSPYIGAMIDDGVDWLARHWKQRPGGLAEAQFLVARAHGFGSWTKFANHLESLRSDEGSPYERAADAIVEGDIETLRELLGERPGLVHKRSARDHHSTLLHYAAANGIEDFRQKTPRNIVEIAALLLDAGADVNAESDAYSGRSTTLGLAATSVHPEKAGVQIALMELLLDRGATLDGPDGRVNACLANGRAMAAEYLATRGAKVDLEGAAGLGWIEAVRELFSKGVTHDTLVGAFGWACQFGRTEVATFLLDHGVRSGEHMRYHEQTGLHWARWRRWADVSCLPGAGSRTEKGSASVT
jgi:ankyrin repeat protein